MTTLRAPERVLPTLNGDGTRRWVRPRLFQGKFYQRRLVTAWTLIALFAGLPFLRIQGKPAVLLDVRHWEFTLFGRTFLPTDGVLLMLLLLAIFVTVFLVTAVLGRAWCGWACPQTVYMEFLFRPIERLIEGDQREQARLDREGPNLRRLLKTAVFLVLSALLGNLFLSYFVGTATLAHWMRGTPSEHPTAFLVMGVTSALVFFDFTYFREQMCTVACPYARLQSALLDKKSLLVAYDSARGEPRGKKGRTKGDCVDCGLCVAACPTGIDIRNGLQLECIACTQCVDACDGVMHKLKRPLGLIRYTSEEALATKTEQRRSFFRPRVVAYVTALCLIFTALGVAASSRSVAEVSLLRGIDTPFVAQGDLVRNHVRIKIQNRTGSAAAYTLTLLDAPDTDLVLPENPLHVPSGEHATESLFLIAPKASFHAGKRDVRLRVSDGAAFDRTLSYRLLGPETESRENPEPTKGK
jgi:cytochrome c oxidase accessory protein FixG